MNSKATTLTLIVALTLILVFFGGLLSLQAQQTATSGGGDAFSSDGTVSYSIGQIAYEYYQSAEGSVSQGSQQAYQIITLGTDGPSAIVLQALVYPNPTVSYINLKIEDKEIENLSYQLYDNNGRLILNQTISNLETQIPMEELRSAIYFLKVSNHQKVLKSFKVVKN